ncbi:helix-turn-helix domain-containing protein [Bacillus sp. FJAT-49705]|uniref:Helix-turn-helix domain-containing protein n=1 Tax=Cytobacillus citreus TaxID=2833586 RepID=A0ABS5NSR9_9BACI|nr:helix-turn-helix domain-containing protein [Cytobacillus citreus]MBS4189964.1 helix-turn-helix domain-containing protein [Cytobacillus citreus]
MSKVWNLEEIEYLKEQIGVHKITTIAQTMDRSYHSVIVKMNRLGISNTKLHTGLITIGELAKLVKVDRNTVKWWVEKHGLPCTKKVTRKSKGFYFIDPSDFWKWAEENKDRVQFSNIDSKVLLPEPEWVQEERQKENDVVKKRAYKTWTTKEDQLLLKLRSEGLTFTEIAVKMNRSSISVARRIKRI